MPKMDFGFDFDVTLATIPIGPVAFKIGAFGGFSAAADLGFGFDTSGIQKAIKTGNSWDAFDGFFLSDWTLPSAGQLGGEEKDEFTFYAEVGLKASVQLGPISGGLKGSVYFDAGVDFMDVYHDGKIHPSELATMWNYAENGASPGPQNLVNLDGRLGLKIGAEAKVWTPFGKETVVDEELADITLLDLSYNAPHLFF